MGDERSGLIEAARALGVSLSEAAAGALLRLLDELVRWNRAYNLTAISDRQEMVTHHLLDSLSILPALHGKRVADVGTGAGFPGLPLAIADPDRHFTLIDSNNKKVRFVAHVARALSLPNVTAVHARAESFDAQHAKFDTVVCRAFAALPLMLALIDPLCGPDTQVLAMKGKRPDDEIAAVPADWQVLEVRPLTVPGLNAERHLVVLRRAARMAAPPV